MYLFLFVYNSYMKKYIIKSTSLVGTYSIYLLYAIISLITLKTFPLIHSDEIWLGKLSYTYLSNQTIYITEPFFDLFPRQTHTIKVLFHMIQMPFIATLGLNIFSIRFISLLFGISSLLLLHYHAKLETKNTITSLLLVMLVGLNTQFIYASHFARQEIILFTILIGVFIIYFHSNIKLKKRIVIIGICIGISIGIHPNAFIIAFMIGSLLVAYYFIHKLNLIHLFIYGGMLAFFAVIYIITSFIENPDFITNYLVYGDSLAISATHNTPLISLYNFYLKIYNQIGATYYLPNIRFLFYMVFILLLLMVILYFFVDTKKGYWISYLPATSLFIGFNISILIIGRYNPTSIIFILFPIFLLLQQVISYLSTIIHRYYIILLLCLAVFISLNHSYIAYAEYENNNFDCYTEIIKSHLEEDSVILGNLSSGFAFDQYTFYDIRNLAYLEKQTLNQYIEARGINTIIYYEEYDYIHRNSKWNILYGDDSSYYDDLQSLINTRGTLIHSFTDSYYGIRIIPYTGDYPWKIMIYTID